MKTLISIAFALTVIACGTTEKKTEIENQFGAKVDTANAILVADIQNQMAGKPEMPVTIKGKITEVCQREGCWLNMENGNGNMMVRMKDHAFVVPKDITGRTIYVQGTAIMDTTSVEDLRHYAMDAGKSEAEIQAITEPETELIVQANGVVLLKQDAVQK